MKRGNGRLARVEEEEQKRSNQQKRAEEWGKEGRRRGHRAKKKKEEEGRMKRGEEGSCWRRRGPQPWPMANWTTSREY
jgi:hypothetical protein